MPKDNVSKPCAVKSSPGSSKKKGSNASGTSVGVAVKEEVVNSIGGKRKQGGSFIQKEATNSAVTRTEKTPQKKDGATADRFNRKEAVKAEKGGTVDVRSKKKPNAALAVTNWNINGPGSAKKRDEVVKATLEGKALEAKADILCIQENTFSCSKGSKRSYERRNERFPRELTGCVEQREENSVYNVVLYNKEKFEIIQDGPGTAATYIEKAYKLMNIEKDIIDWIHEGGDERLQNFRRNPDRCTSDIMKHMTKKKKGVKESHIRKIIKDIRQQIETYKSKDEGSSEDKATDRAKLAFEDCRNHFIRHKVPGTEKAKDFLGKRAAMVLLRPKGTDTTLLVISFHSYNPSLRPDRLNYLLLDFIEKLYWVTDSITVLIGGDFNEDIKKSKDVMVQELQKGYTCEKYALTELRLSVKNKPGRIDYILLRKPSTSKDSLSQVRARNMTIKVSQEDQKLSPEDQKRAYLKNLKKVTNHSPLETTLKIQQTG